MREIESILLICRVFILPSIWLWALLTGKPGLWPHPSGALTLLSSLGVCQEQMPGCAWERPTLISTRPCQIQQPKLLAVNLWAGLGLG